jgi:hypothetical protein
MKERERESRKPQRKVSEQSVEKKNIVFWDMTPSLVTADISEEIIASIFGMKIINELGRPLTVARNCSTLHSELQLLVRSNIVPSSLNVFTPKMEAISSSETLVLAMSTRHYIPEDDILRHPREHPKSYTAGIRGNIVYRGFRNARLIYHY